MDGVNNKTVRIGEANKMTPMNEKYALTLVLLLKLRFRHTRESLAQLFEK